MPKYRIKVTVTDHVNPGNRLTTERHVQKGSIEDAFKVVNDAVGSMPFATMPEVEND